MASHKKLGLGADFFDKLNPIRVLNRPTKRIQNLGFDVQVSSAPGASRVIRCSILIAIMAQALLFSAIPLKAEPGPSTVDLRGYGKVAAVFTPMRAEFTCESPETAEIPQGKLLADLFWDSKIGHSESQILLNGKSIVIHECPPYGALLVARSHIILNDSAPGYLIRICPISLSVLKRIGGDFPAAQRAHFLSS